MKHSMIVKKIEFLQSVTQCEIFDTSGEMD